MTLEQEYELAENEFIEAVYGLSDPLKICGDGLLKETANVVAGVLAEAIRIEDAKSIQP